MSKTQTLEIDVDLSVTNRINFALVHTKHQNVIRELKLTNQGYDPTPPLLIETVILGISHTSSKRIPEIPVNQSIHLDPSFQPILRCDKICQLSIPLETQIQVLIQKQLYAERLATLLPVNVLNCDPQYLTALAAYVLPEHNVVQAIVRRAQHQLEAHYPDATPNERACAICTCMYEEFKLKYSWERPEQGLAEQHVRFPHDLVKEWKGTCVDMALLLAACLENIRNCAVICLLEKLPKLWHAMTGFWTNDKYQTQIMVRNTQELRQVIKDKQLQLIDVEELLKCHDKDFYNQAIKKATSQVQHCSIVGLINIEEARQHGITPLPIKEPPINLSGSGLVEATETDSQVKIPPARLRIINGSLLGQEFRINRSRMIIGRNDDCDIRLPVKKISREHAEIIFDEEVFWLRDLNSKNGIFLICGKDGMIERRSSVQLEHGTRFRFGTVLEFEFVSED